MPYIATKPGTAFRTFTDKDTFSGDGSTTVFDMQFAIAESGQNDLEVFVGGTRKLPETDFTLGVDGAGDYKRITFTSAPAAGTNNIVILNPGTVQGEFSTVADNAVTNLKLNVSAINSQTELAEQANDNDEYLIYDASASALKKIKSSNVTPNKTLITGKNELATGAASNDLVLIYDVTADELKKITQTNLLNFPSVSSISPSNALSGDGTGNHTIVVTGQGFVGATIDFIDTDGNTITADSQSVDSATQITVTIAKSKLPNSGEPFDVRVQGGSGLRSTLENALNIDAQPVFQTAAGSLGNFESSTAISAQTLAAHDPESGAAPTYILESGSLPAGLSGASTSSGYVITGTPNAVNTNTTSTFTIRAIDAASNTSDRTYTMTITPLNYFGDGSDGALDTTP